jgi:hypothetical protein
LKIRLLDLGVLALLALLALLSWQMRREWVWAHAREQTLLRSRLKPAAVPLLAPLSNVEPLAATGYAPVAGNNLFSKDRNPNVIIDPPLPPQEKPVPPFPVARGVMLWPGAPPTVVLSSSPGGPQKGYRPGDVIGQWKIVSVDNKYVGLEWDGKQFKKRLDELFDKSSVVAEVPQASTPQNPSGSATNLSAPGNAKSGPGIETGAGQRACVVGDTSPAGTVVEGMKKIVTQGLMGNSCRWEAVK